MTTPTNPAIARLVDRQMRNWELARAQRLSRPEPARSEVEEFVCLSRMVGIGDEVATGIAERLGWPVFDKQLLDAMAGDDHRRRRIYASMDERDLGWWREALAPLVWRQTTRNDYFHRLCETVLSLARQGSAVFVGRGADRILPADLGLRVRLIAPLELRARWYAEAAGGSLVAARREIARIEGERGRFLRAHFDVDALDPLRHDLTLNLGRLDPRQAIEIVLAARPLAARSRSRQRVGAEPGCSPATG